MSDATHAIDTLSPSRPVTIALCILHGSDHASVAHQESLDQALGRGLHFQGRPVQVARFSATGDEYSRGRNAAVQFVEDAERAQNWRFDYILWLDDDIIVPPDFLQRLLDHNLPIVSGTYIMRREPHLPVAYIRAHEPERSDRFWNLPGWPQGLAEVDAVGQGCVLIKREVYDRVPKPYYAWQPVKRDAENTFKLLPDEEPGRNVAVEDRSLGEDLYFFTHCREAGYVVYVDGTVELGHQGTHIFTRYNFEQAKHTYRRTPQPGRLSILFIPAPAPKVWDGSSLNTEGLGGSESAVAYLARELAQRHFHAVTVVSGRDNADIDGVNYRPQTHLATLLASSWDVIIVSRWREALFAIEPDLNRIKRVFFWMHDVTWLSALRDVYDRANALVQLTPWHAATSQYDWPERVGMPEHIIPNGVDNALFAGREERVPGRLVWTSNPNRGLPSAVRIFRKLRQRWPHLELHVYGRYSVYGWSPDEERMWLPDPDEPGVVLHDALPKAQLARELMKAWAWFYPNHWLETFSIAALEAQAAGTPVISVPYGALPNTVAGGLLNWDIEQSVEELMDEEYWELLSHRGKELARTWDWKNVSDEWERIMRAELEKE